MAFKIVAWLIVIALVGGLGAFFFLQEPVLEVTITQIHRSDVEETVASIAAGAVMPPRSAMLAVGALGVIDKVHVKEGDLVKENDLLIELDHEELDAQVTLSEANLRVGKSRLEQARLVAEIYEDIAATKVRQSSAQLEQAQADHRRISALADRKAISQSELDKVALALNTVREVHTATQAGQRENQVRAEEVKSTQVAIEQLEAALTAAKALREKAFVRAPFDGVVAKIILKEGEAVAMGLPLMHLVQTEDCYIEAPFDEANTDQLEMGLPVRIELDAYPRQEFAGEVSWISPVVTMNKDLSRTLNLKVKILEEADKFLPGMSADVTVITQEKEQVLAVPSESLIRDEYAYVIREGRAARQDVELGIGNWEYHELLAGLEEGDAIITSIALKELKEGVRVQVVEELKEY